MVNQPGGDRGFILVSVLWALALLAVMAALLMNTVRTNTKAQANLLHREEAAALGDGIIQLVALKLTAPRRASVMSHGLRLDGTPLICRNRTSTLIIQVSDAAGMVDLNGAPAALLLRLLTGLGLDVEKARILARAIVEFRSGRRNMASNEAYRAAGLPFGPKRGPFQTVGELDQVVGMTPELFSRMRPLVTVHSKRAGIDPSVAALPVLKALTGNNQTTGPTPRTPSRALSTLRAGVPAQYRLRSLSRVFSIRATVLQPGGGRFAREAVIELAAVSKFGFRIKEWTKPQLAKRQNRPTSKRLLRCKKILAH